MGAVCHSADKDGDPMNRSLFKSVWIIAVLALAGGCAQPPLKVTPIAKTGHPAALADALRQRVAAAEKEQVDVLSPGWFAKVRASLERARAGIEKGGTLNAILDHIATGNAQLEQALKVALASGAMLPEVIDSRNAAIGAGARRYEKDFSRAEADFLKLTRAVENGDAETAQRRKKAVDDAFRGLELRAITDAALGEVRGLMEKGRAMELDELAPRSFMVAGTKLEDAERTIVRNRYDETAIAEKVQIAKFYGERMLRVGETVKALAGKSTEEMVLRTENRLSRINALLDGPDSRDRSFDDQERVISDAIGALKRNRSSLTSLLEAKNLEIDRLNKRVSLLEGRTYQERMDKERLAADKQRLTADARRLEAERERLAAEKRFNALYTQVQGFFSADQAEVYKQANQLVIRLKAIQFSVGRSDIQPDNYPLLTTVQDAIDAFGRPDVTIEGHTDSTGTEAANQELSQLRAEAVRRYLIENGPLSAGQITAVGFGSSRPLASNATKAGRAVNRRIDVVIHPKTR
jgi:outer membrane protein OmpA-like peptidoglycan-associated protein